MEKKNFFDKCPIDFSTIKFCPTNGNFHVKIEQKALEHFPEYSTSYNLNEKLQKLKDCDIKRLLEENFCYHNRYNLNHQLEDVYVKNAMNLYDISREEAQFHNRAHIFTDIQGNMGNCDVDDIVNKIVNNCKRNKAIEYRDLIYKNK